MQSGQECKTIQKKKKENRKLFTKAVLTECNI